MAKEMMNMDTLKILSIEFITRDVLQILMDAVETILGRLDIDESLVIKAAV